jgi:hypothetical protein
MYYYTSDTSENDASGAEAKADESSRVIKSKHREKPENQNNYVLFQNQVKMAPERPLAPGLVSAASNS